MIRRITEGPLRFMRENEAAIARLQQFAQGIDTTALERVARAFEANDVSARIQAITELTDTAFAKFRTPEAVAQMEQYAKRHQEIYAVVQRIALPYRDIAREVESMSAYV